MKIIKLVCSNCGAKLNAQSDIKEYMCEYCNTVNVLDDEIIKVEHLFEDKKKEEKFKIADTYLEDFENYEEAFEIYERMSKEYTYEPKVWIQLIRAKTEKYKKEENIDLSEIILCDEYMKRYLALEKNEQQKNKNKKEYEEYKNKIIKNCSNIEAEKKFEKIILIGVFVVTLMLTLLYFFTVK